MRIIEEYFCVKFIFSATFPIDLTKTRLQIQGQIFDNASQKSQYGEKKYTNMFQAMYRLVIHIEEVFPIVDLL